MVSHWANRRKESLGRALGPEISQRARTWNKGGGGKSKREK